MQRQRELDRLKEEFVAVVSHELRTPLTVVYGGIETLQRPTLTAEARAHLFGIIRQEAGRLAKLVDDVLWASRPEAGPQITRERFDPSPLLAGVTEAARQRAPEQVTIAAAAHGRLPQGVGGRANVERVLSNLLDNAIKYSPDGGTIGVGARSLGDRLRFWVSDEGLGIPEEHRETVFEKFTRLDPDMARGIGGTGLGLYICRRLVEQMGGRIWVEPNRENGSIFSFEVPAAAGTSEVTTEPAN
jgi:signal transduction histidine kinase